MTLASPLDLRAVPWTAFAAADELGRLDDAELAARAAAALAEPRHDPADSFVLHAPLELVARAELLRRIEPAARPAARLRIASLAGAFQRWGRPVDPPGDEAFDDLPSAARSLVDAIARGDLDDVDVAARWIGRSATAAQLRSLLAADVVLRTSAAAHAPIFLELLPKVAPHGELTGELLRGLARELAREPGWHLRWLGEQGRREPASGAALLDAVAAAPALGVPGSTFIHPLMDQVDRTGVAAELLAGVTGGRDVAERAAVLLRIAAWSMLQEPPDHAPYGWSHCLTIPQAVLGLAPSLPDPSLAVAVAATHAVGFRAALAARPLDPAWSPDPDRLPVEDALVAGRERAAASAWHLPPADRPAWWRRLGAAGATGHDAHQAKYVLACWEAATTDPAFEHLYLAAASSLVAWWHDHPDPSDPLLGVTSSAV